MLSKDLQRLTEDTVKVSKETMDQLLVKRETVTPFWWAIRVFLKVKSQ